MKREEKTKLAGCIALLDQALAPLTNAHKVIDGLADDEEATLDEAQNQDSDAMLERRDKLEELRGFVEKLGEMVDEIPNIKSEIEGW